MNINEIAAAKSNFVARAVGEELFLVHPRNKVTDMNQLFTLNELGHFMWNEIQLKTTFDLLLEKIIAEREVESDIARADLTTFHTELSSFLHTDNA